MELTEQQVKLWSLVLVELEESGGVYYCSIRGLARLLDVSVSTFTDGRVRNGRPRGLFWRLMLCAEDELPPALRHLAGFNYQESPMLPQDVIKSVVSYYAKDAVVIKERAVELLEILDLLWQ